MDINTTMANLTMFVLPSMILLPYGKLWIEGAASNLGVQESLDADYVVDVKNKVEAVVSACEYEHTIGVVFSRVSDEDDDSSVFLVLINWMVSISYRGPR